MIRYHYIVNLRLFKNVLIIIIIIILIIIIIIIKTALLIMCHKQCPKTYTPVGNNKQKASSIIYIRCN